MKLGLESCSGTMERDFMGLNSKDSVVAVKEEVVEVCKESGAILFNFVRICSVFDMIRIDFVRIYSVFDLIGTDLVQICLVVDLIITD
ncbi:hypothetical protein Hanom_Chr01g00011241 [Helianthus anomalus]